MIPPLPRPFLVLLASLPCAGLAVRHALADGEDRILVRAWHKGLLEHPVAPAAVERFARDGFRAGAATPF